MTQLDYANPHEGITGQPNDLARVLCAHKMRSTAVLLVLPGTNWQLLWRSSG